MSTGLVKDLERRLRKRSEKIAELEAVNKELRQQLEAYESLNGSMHPEYVAVVADITHAAYNGIRRPADLGGPVTGRHAESNPPKHDPRAYALLNDVRRDQSGAAESLRKRLAKIVDGPTPPKEETG